MRVRKPYPGGLTADRQWAPYLTQAVPVFVLDALFRYRPCRAYVARMLTDLRETNELSFARFEAKVQQRMSQFEAKFSKQTRFLYVSLVMQMALILAALSR